MADLHRGLVVEYRSQTDSMVMVRQLILFDSVVFSRAITTENPRRHWKAYEIAKPAEHDLSARLDIVREWLNEVNTSFTNAGYAPTMEPYAVEATEDEYQTQILTGTTPRNVILRVDRVRSEKGLPDPLERV